MANTPDQVEILLELYRGQNRTDVIESIRKDYAPSDVKLEVEETLPIGEAIGVGIVVKFASEFAWRAYLHGVEPRLKKFGHFIRVKYFYKGDEIPAPKEGDAPSASSEENPTL